MTYFHGERAFFKKDNNSSHSISCYLTLTSNNFVVARNKEQSDVWYDFKVERLLVAKEYRREKKKFYFNIGF